MSEYSLDPSRGFVALPLDILEIPMSPGAFRALVEFCRMADRDGYCWPSLEQVGDKLGRSRAAVSGYVKELRGLSLLSTEEQRTASGYNYRLKFRVTFWAAWRARFGKPEAVNAQAVRSEALTHQETECRVQPDERPLKENQIHQNQPSDGTSSVLGKLHMAWKKVIGTAPYPSLAQSPSAELLSMTREATVAQDTVISADMTPVLASFVKRQGLTPDGEWLATMAPQINRLSRLPGASNLLTAELRRKWRKHWKYLPSKTFVAELVGDLLAENPEVALRNLLSGYLRRWDINCGRLRSVA